MHILQHDGVWDARILYRQRHSTRQFPKCQKAVNALEAGEHRTHWEGIFPGTPWDSHQSRDMTNKGRYDNILEFMLRRAYSDVLYHVSCTKEKRAAGV